MKTLRTTLLFFCMLVGLVGALSPAAAELRVDVMGPGGKRSASLPDTGGNFDLNLPLTKNAVNMVNVTATDDAGNEVTKRVEITQIDFDSLVVAEVKAEPLPPARVQQLVEDGVIDLEDPENFNVSQFSIVLTIGQESIPVQVPIAVPVAAEEGFEVIQTQGDPSGSGRAPNYPDSQIVIFETKPRGVGQIGIPSIPGIIVIDGRIKTLKEFFSVQFLLMNTSGIFTLTEVTAALEFPDGGLSNTLPVDGMSSLGEVRPANGLNPGQVAQEFIVRGDQKGNRRVKVNFGGKVAGPGIPEEDPVPFNGSAETTIEVKGPPEFRVEVSHPDSVVAGVPYEFVVDMTNVGDTPGLYASLELDVGLDARLVSCEIDQAMEPVCEELPGADVRPFGHILPGQTVREVFTIRPLLSGDITSCLGISDQNVDLKVNVGSIGCLVGKFPPGRKDPDGLPSVAVVPVNSTIGVNIDSPVAAFFSKEMNHSTITTGENGTFNVFTKDGFRIPGRLRFDVLNGDSVAVWQVFDGVTNRFAPNTEYTVQIDPGITSVEGEQLVSEFTSRFQTTGEGINDITPPEVSVVVLPPVNPNNVIPGEVIKARVFPVDQGSGISRTELRLRDLSVDGALPVLIDQKKVSESVQPPFNFAIDSRNLIPGHTYELKATAYDGVFNSMDTTFAVVIATSAPNPTVTLPDDTDFEVRQGVGLELMPEQLTGGVVQVAYTVDGAPEPQELLVVPPYVATFRTTGLSLGTHTITAEVVDGLDQTGADTFTFEVVENTVAPTVSFVQPTDGALILQNGSPFVVQIDIDDEVASQNINFYLDDPNAAPLFSGGIGFQLSPAGLDLGMHRIFVEVTNETGVSNSRLDTFVEFEVVDVLPQPAPAAPVFGAIQPPLAGEILVNGTSELGGGRLDITNVTNGVTQTLSVARNGTWQAQLPAAPGDQLTAVAFDISQTAVSDAATAVVPAPKVLRELLVQPATVEFTEAGQVEQLTVRAVFEDDSQLVVTEQADYASADSGIASVGQEGLVAVQGTGTTQITVQLDGVLATVEVNADVRVVESLRVAPQVVSLVAIDEQATLVVEKVFTDQSTEVAMSSEIAFGSSAPFVAAVDTQGVITARDGGNAVVTAALLGSDVLPVRVPVVVDLANDQPPAVSFEAPAEGTTIEAGDLLAVTVRAVDAVGGVRSLTLSTTGAFESVTTIDIALPSGDVTRTFNLLVPTSVKVGQQVELEATATDSSGNTSFAVERVIPISDSVAPVVSITAPINGQQFELGDTVSVTLQATDGDGVSQLEFATEAEFLIGDRQNVRPVAESTTGTFTFAIPTDLSDPLIRINAFAFDSSGNRGEAIPVEIEVSNIDRTPPATEVTATDGGGDTTVVTYQVTEGLEDLDTVLLYFRRNGIGTFNRYTNAAGGNPRGLFSPAANGQGTIVFDSTTMGGSGTYEFLTVGIDQAGNREEFPADGGDMVVADAQQVLSGSLVVTTINVDTAISEGDFTFENQNLLVDGATVTVDGAHEFQNVELVNGAVLRHSPTTLTEEFGLELTVATLTIDSTSGIQVSDLGYLGGLREGNDCSGQTLGNVDGATQQAGGSHGGPGGERAGTTNPIYGLLSSAVELGSGGSCNGGFVGGNGGGRAIISAVNIVADGDIHADGQAGSGNNAGAGSGGSVSLATSTISGVGVISANGGGTQTSGGGGRISITSVDRTTIESSQVTALGNAGGVEGGNGTVFFSDIEQMGGSLVVRGRTNVDTFSPLPIPPGIIFDTVRLEEGALVIVDGELAANSTIEVLTGSRLTHSVGNEDGLHLIADRVIVDETSRVDVSGKGYRGGLSDGNTSCNGETLDGLTLLGAPATSGGTYGGEGADSGNGVARVYGSIKTPSSLGAGGGCNGGFSGGNGGGRLTIDAATVLQVDGQLLANGLVGSGNNAGSGAGGSIHLRTSQLRGTGAIRANGAGNQRAGGGGRVAVEFDFVAGAPNDFGGLREITAAANNGGIDGAAGTVYLLRSNQDNGSLILDSEEVGGRLTTFSSAGFGQVQAINGDTFTVSTPTPLVVNALVGTEVNPNLEQEQVFTVIANDETTVTLAPNGAVGLADVAAVGDKYAWVHLYDEIVLRGEARVSLNEVVRVSEDLVITESSELTHSDVTLVELSKIDIDADRVFVDETSSIDVVGRGFVGGLSEGNPECEGRTFENLPGSGVTAAGSYGGLGATRTGAVSSIYGAVKNPVEHGGGGGCAGGFRGGDGGGRVNIVATNVTIDGLLTANGQSGSGNNAGSGAGGAVLINAGTVSGAGVISADGGSGQTSGGGGRVAIRYQALNLARENVTARGGAGTVDGGSGTVFFQSSAQAFGDLLFDGRNLAVVDQAFLPAGETFDNITIQNGAIVVADSGITVTDTLELSSDSTLTHSVANETGVDITARVVAVDATSAIDVSGRGYHGGLVPGTTNGCSGTTLGGLVGASQRAAGSYGGYGGESDTNALTNEIYGNPSAPSELGSGGGCSGAFLGGNGGGHVSVIATSSVSVQGSILANGGNGTGNNAGAGSGGSIVITTPLLTGDGLVSASGGGTQVSGAGGRVLVEFDQLGTGAGGDDLAGGRSIVALGRNGTALLRRGSPGTVIIRDRTSGEETLIIDSGRAETDTSVASLPRFGFGKIVALNGNTITTDAEVVMIPNGLVGLLVNPNIQQTQSFVVESNTVDTITLSIPGGLSLSDFAAVGDEYAGVYQYDEVLLRGGALLELADPLTVMRSLSLSEAAALSHVVASLTREPRLIVNAGAIDIPGGTAINVAGKGYLGGLVRGNDCSGQTVGNTDGSASFAGGSHGGLGAFVNGAPNPTYGNPLNPVDLGAGGGCGGAFQGGNGGGAVQLFTGSLQVDGVIVADGAPGTGNNSGSGAGGSVAIVTDVFGGEGTIRANGLGGQVPAGGGRIAVTRTVDTFNGLLEAISVPGTRPAEDGTVVVQ